LLKRRGPQMPHPITLALPPVLPPSVAASLAAREAAQMQPQATIV